MQIVRSHLIVRKVRSYVPIMSFMANYALYCFLSSFVIQTPFYYIQIIFHNYYISRWIFSDKQEFAGIQQEFYRNSTGIQIKLLKVGRHIRLCYSRHLIFTRIENYQNSVYRNSSEFTEIPNSCLSDKIHRDMGM